MQEILLTYICATNYHGVKVLENITVLITCFEKFKGNNYTENIYYRYTLNRFITLL